MVLDFVIENELNNVLYWGRNNSLHVTSNYLENEGLNYNIEIKALSPCFIKGTYPIIEIIPIEKPICTIQVFLSNELILTKHFIVVDMPNPLLCSNILRNFLNESSTNKDEIIHSTLELDKLMLIKELTAKFIMDAYGNHCIIFQISQFNFSILRNGLVIFNTVNKGNILNKEIEDFKKDIEVGDKLLIEYIVCYLDEYKSEQRVERNFNYNIINVI